MQLGKDIFIEIENWDVIKGSVSALETFIVFRAQLTDQIHYFYYKDHLFTFRVFKILKFVRVNLVSMDEIGQCIMHAHVQ